ncbi:TNF receptor-associated factor 3, partial [Exaiptasia diaphana]|uniref:Uncharacterized protein n=1 Tax=Exaiptasia diaphana TaxID=2652724 RepID=A0A913XDR7_EXADI
MESIARYDVEFVNPIEKKYVCPLCKKALQDAMQTECGHRFCASCIDPILRKPNPHCPLDGEPLTEGAFKDVCCRREIGSLFCYCIFKKHGCTWQKELMYLKDHLSNCEFQEIPCPNPGCEEMVPKNKLEHHKHETCSFKPSRCQHCGQLVPEVHMESHLHTCDKFPMTCERCGTSNIAREDMQHHLERECSESEKPCKFYYAGCPFKAKDDVMNEHDQSQKSEHLNLMLEFSRKKEQKEINLSEKLEKVEQENISLQSQLSTHRETLAASTQDLRSYQTRLGKVEQIVGEHRREIADLKERLPVLFTSHFDYNNGRYNL